MEKLYKNPENSLQKVADEMKCSVIAVEKRATRHKWFNKELSQKRTKLNGKSRAGIDYGAKGRSIYHEQMYQVHLNYQKIGTKDCTRCGATLPIKQFRPLPPKQQVYLDRNVTKRISHCNTCERKRTAKFKSEKSSTIEGTAVFLMDNVRRRCREKNLECEIDAEWIIETFKENNARCFYSGKKMDLLTNRKISREGGGYKKNNKYNVSLDRIDPEKGYLKSNTVLCCWIFNNLKQDLSFEEFMQAINDVYTFKNSTKLKT